LIVTHDKKIDFEDLAVFTLMWNWYTGQELAQKAVVYAKPASGIQQSCIRLEPRDDGTIAILSDTMPDYLSLLVTADSKNETGLTVSADDFWTVGNTGVVLTRTVRSNEFEFASGILDAQSNGHAGPFTLGAIRFTGKLDRNDVVQVVWRFRSLGEETIAGGTTVLTRDSLPLPKPTEFSLLQNSPNPFNPSTTISYALPVDSQVELSIFTVEGKLVTRLVDTTVSAGIHSVTWNARSMPSGMYFYSLRAGSYSETKKMMIVK